MQNIIKISVWIVFGSILLLQACHTTQSARQSGSQWLVQAPAGDQYCQIQPATGSAILPNGRIIRPMGTTIRIAPHPYGLCLSPNGKVAVTANSGNRPFSITLLEDQGTGKPLARQIPEGPMNDPKLLEDVFMGLAITPDDGSVWVSGGSANQLFRYDLRSGAKLDSIQCAQAENPDGYLGDLVLTKDGSRLFVCDQSNFRLLVVDTRARKVLHYLPVGRYPFGIALSPDERTVYVANVGMFEYSPFINLDQTDLKATGADFPSSAFGSEDMRKGYQKGRLEVPALGDPNVPESFSVWAVDVSSAQPTVVHKVKTGFLVGEKIDGIPAVGGASPNSVVANEQFVFVSNGNNDCVSVIDPIQGKVVQNIFLKPLPQLARYRGVIPFGLTLSPDQKRLYVAESGINAVAVIDVGTFQVLGHLPVGWFPSKLAVTPDGKKLIVANAKGFGSGPNGGFTFAEGPEGTYVGHLMHGSVTFLDIPADQDLPRWTKQVLDNNFSLQATSAPAVSARKNNPVPVMPGATKSPIKHIVFISKENRTYDEVFGQLKNGNGDPAIARYG
ncbi:MAG: hypothetical protein IT260_12975, partial [Saprospiraceae bacterium]|nr:hypothetical protein [Saprospiraceae bacterium]